MTEFSPTTPGFFDATGAIARDHDCHRCGYNLRGLREDGRCPECGTSVGLSTQGNLLRFADPEWVDKLAKGLTIILWMILANVLVGALGVGLGASESTTGALGFVVALISFWGAWLMTEPDPSGIGETGEVNARKVVRCAIVVGLAGGLMGGVVKTIGGTAAASSAVTAFMLFTGIMTLVGEFAKFTYYAQLARRIPDDALASRASLLKWGFTITLAVSLLVGVSVAASTAGGGAPTSGVATLGCLILPAALAWIVFSVMTLFLLIRLRRALAEQALLARQTWASTDAPF